MPENNPQIIKPEKPTPQKPEPITDYGHVAMGEEFSKARWTLPPVGIVAIALVAVAIIVGVISWTSRPKPGARGTIDDIGAVATDPNNVMVGVQFSLTNVTDKPFWVKSVSATLVGDNNQEYTDTAASVADFERYFQAFPDLKQHAAAEPIKADTKIPPGGNLRASAIFSFPLSKDAFDKRKSLTITIQPYDQPRAVVITK
jgi:hypothetical protein